VNRKDNTDDVIALKIDFFGVKGRVEEEIPEADLNEGYKNDGSTACEIEIN
jgi:hypothetical protein